MKLCESCHNGFYGSPDRCPVCHGDLRSEAELSGLELVGMVVADKYVLREVLGEGAMGWVYRGVHQSLDRSVAVKLLKVGGEAQKEQVNRFELEARAISRLHHPHIVSVIDFGRTPGGIFYLVTEFVEGTTLSDLLFESAREMTPRRVIGLFHQILAAVEEAHSAQIIHRDLKPDNIVVMPLRSGDDFVKVLDFGIAMLSDDPRPRVTAKGATVGTPGFMAPETIMEGRADERSDIYSLGNILYEMLVGRPPFDHEWPMALLSMHLNEQPALLRQAAPEAGYPAALEQVVSRALAKKPDERFASIAEFRTELTDALRQMGRVELDCDRCSRPRDPNSGLCSLHGLHGPDSGTRPRASEPGPPSGPPMSTPSPLPPRPAVDATSRTLVQQTAIHRESLIARIRGTDVVGRDAEAEQLASFLTGPGQLLELAGEPGIGKSYLLEGLSLAAESLGLRVLRMQPDPRNASRPWYPVRQLVSALLGCGMRPADPAEVTDQAQALGLSAEHDPGLALLFGFSHARAPARWFDRAKVIRRAAAAVLAVQDAESPGSCLVIEDALAFDRASQSFVRTLPRRLDVGWGKIVLSSDGAFWPQRKDRELLRPTPIDLEGMEILVQRAGLDGAQDGRATAARLLERSKGNPLHAQQALLALREGLPLDGSLAELLSRRLATLPPETTELLRAVSALGQDVPLELLTGLVDEDLQMLATDMLLRRGYLQARVERSVAPAHPTLARTVLEAMPATERKRLHAAIIERLRSAGGSVFLQAHHAWEGELEDEALELLTRAGDEACRWSDVETAALVHYRRATHVARWRLLWSEEDPRTLEIALKMGSALLASGHTRAAEVVFKEVLGAARHHPHLADRARHGLEALDGS